jgi:hypothetical protein
VFLPGGAVHRTSGHLDRGKTRPQPAHSRLGTDGGGGEGSASRSNLVRLFQRQLIQINQSTGGVVLPHGAAASSRGLWSKHLQGALSDLSG